jgi:hypothetical protein
MNTILFNSVYTFGKTELNLTDRQALTLAQFVIDNIDTLRG